MGRQTGQQRETVALRCLECGIAYRKRQVYRADSSDSTVLWDHKAFLFDEQEQLLALPVSMNSFVIRDEQYSKGYWQGAYIFAVASEQDFSLRGIITHQDDGT